MQYVPATLAIQAIGLSIANHIEPGRGGLIFMQFSEKFGHTIGWCPYLGSQSPPLEILGPPLVCVQDSVCVQGHEGM